MRDVISDLVPLLSVRDLKVAFRTQEGLREVLHGVSFDIFPGETVAIVEEIRLGQVDDGDCHRRSAPRDRHDHPRVDHSRRSRAHQAQPS